MTRKQHPYPHAKNQGSLPRPLALALLGWLVLFVALLAIELVRT